MGKTTGRDTAGGKPPPPERAARLRAALRANLVKRKQRTAGPATESVPDDGD